MVNSDWGYQVQFFDKSNGWASTDITTFAFPRQFSDVVEAEVKTGLVRIRADDGQFIKAGINGIAFKIEVGDRLQIVSTDGAGDSWDYIYEIIRKKPIKSKREGIMLELELLGLERWAQKIHYSKRHFASTAKLAMQDLVDDYNDSVKTGSLDIPTMSISRNELPDTQLLTLDWGVNEDTIFNRMHQLKDMMGGSAVTGGILDFFDIRFETTLDTPTVIDVQIFSSGDAPTKPTVTVSSDDVNINTEDTDAGFEETEGTQIHAWGANGQGSKPINWSKFQARDVEMPTEKGSDSLFPEWDSTFDYKIGALIKYTAGAVNLVYKALTNNDNQQPNTNPSDWQLQTRDSYVGAIQYSPWTDGKHILWKNSGGDPNDTGSGPFGPGMWDGNIIINDDVSYRTWVDLKDTSPIIETAWRYPSGTVRPGTRVLVNGTGTGAFVGFDNQIMEWTGTEWRQLFVTKDDMLVAVIDDMDVFRFLSGSWSSIQTESNGLDCFHPMDTGTTFQSEGPINQNDGANTQFTNNTDSAVSARFTFTPLFNWLEEMISVLSGVDGALGGKWPQGQNMDTVGWYKAGAWLNLRFPLPTNTFNSAGDVGSIEGGSPTTNIFPYIDQQNMSFTSGGNTGFNHGEESEELGHISALEFNMKLLMQRQHTIAGLATVSKGNFKMRCTLIDARDHVVTQDFVLTHNDNWQSISLPISGFEIYRGRRPRFAEGFTLADIIPPIGRPEFSIFEWRHIAMMCIQTQESYDEFGRYRSATDNDLGTGSPFWENLLDATVNFQLTLSIDAVRWAKPLLVNSGEITSGILKQPDFLQKSDIGSYNQLKNDVQAELEKAQFEKKIYQIKTEVAYDIRAGDFFLFEDDEIVDESDTQANTIELVAKHIDYGVSKSDGQSGGFFRVITGSKRFT